MSGRRYTDEFKIEAVRQVTEHGRPVVEVAQRLGVTSHSLYAWMKAFSKPEIVRRAELDEIVEVRRLQAELKRVTEERGILKKSRRVLCQGVRAKYAFIRDHLHEFRLVTMCRALRVHRSGYYAWQHTPHSPRSREDSRLVGSIKHHWIASGGVYGHRKLTTDLREIGEACSRHRVLRLMQAEGLRAQIGYGSKPLHHSGPVGQVDNVLARNFSPDGHNKVWATDITYIRTYDGWIYLAAVMDLYSRQIVGWAMRPAMTTDLALQALLAAVWRRKPGPGLVVHSDQGSQYTSDDWQSFLQAHGMVASMSRRGNCHDNAVAKSFFSLLKKERIKHRIYPSRAAASSDVFDYIEMFYKPVRLHGFTAGLSPVEFERRYAQTGS